MLTPQVEDRALSLPEQAKAAAVIQTPAQAQHAKAVLQNITLVRKQIAETFDPIIARANAAHKEALDKKKGFDQPLAAGERLLRDGLGTFASEEEARLAAAQAHEQQLIADEAAALEAAGDQVGAELLRDIPVPVPIVEIAGLGTRNVYSVQITDVRELCAAVAAGDIPPAAVSPNLPYLNAHARKEKHAFAVRGCQLVVKKAVVNR